MRTGHDGSGCAGKALAAALLLACIAATNVQASDDEVSGKKLVVGEGIRLPYASNKSGDEWSAMWLQKFIGQLGGNVKSWLVPQASDGESLTSSREAFSLKYADRRVPWWVSGIGARMALMDHDGVRPYVGVEMAYTLGVKPASKRDAQHNYDESRLGTMSIGVDYSLKGGGSIYLDMRRSMSSMLWKLDPQTGVPRNETFIGIGVNYGF